MFLTAYSKKVKYVTLFHFPYPTSNTQSKLRLIEFIIWVSQIFR